MPLYAYVDATSGQSASWRAKTITKNSHLIDEWKLLVPKAGSRPRARAKPAWILVLGPPLLAEPGSVCTQTYLVAGPLDVEGRGTECRVAICERDLSAFLFRCARSPRTSAAACTHWVPHAAVGSDVDRCQPLQEVRHHEGRTSPSSSRMIRPMERRSDE